MKYQTLAACTAAVTLTLAMACSDGAESPISPSGANPGAGAVGPANETLKATAPEPQSPVNNAQPEQLIFTAGKSSAPFDASAAAGFAYEFQVKNGAGAVLCSGSTGGGSGSSVTWAPSNCSLEMDAPHTWSVRATLAGAAGPWSADTAFRAPAGGYIRGNEVFDPLTNGETVGEIIGDVTFIPGVGVKLNGFGSHIRYRLPETLTEGEYSMIITGMPSNTEGGKTKVMAMSEGLNDIVTNDRRMTVEKRGDPAGVIAWRIITRDDQVDTVGPERVAVAFDPSQSYLFTTTWNGFFNVRIQRGGSSGEQIYSKGKPYEGVYDPNPHYAFVGAPQGRSGITGASVPGMIVRNVWISSRPRPANLN
jgi:hypothetical protein